MSIIKRLKNNKKKYASVKQFIRYLKENGIYNAYLRNIKNSKSQHNCFNTQYNHDLYKFFSECDPGLWLNACFVWSEQPEGDDFWENFHFQWYRKFLRSKKQ